jgi:DNA-binding CsgD family transcriptional regulator
MIEQGATNKSLTRRQVQILELLAEGASDAEVARALGIAERTLRWHLANVHARLGTRSRVQMVAEALRHRILPCPCPHADECPLCPSPADGQA